MRKLFFRKLFAIFLVEFTLPEEYRKEWFKKYYIGVRSFTK